MQISAQTRSLSPLPAVSMNLRRLLRLLLLLPLLLLVPNDWIDNDDSATAPGLQTKQTNWLCSIRNIPPHPPPPPIFTNRWHFISTSPLPSVSLQNERTFGPFCCRRMKYNHYLLMFYCILEYISVPAPKFNTDPMIIMVIGTETGTTTRDKHHRMIPGSSCGWCYSCFCRCPDRPAFRNALQIQDHWKFRGFLHRDDRRTDSNWNTECSRLIVIQWCCSREWGVLNMNIQMFPTIGESI